jgi:hypothetical protein
MRPIAAVALAASLAVALPAAAAPPQSATGGAPTGAASQGMSNTHGLTGVRPPGQSSALPLTTGECRGLGGTVHDVAERSYFCSNKTGAGQICITVDKNGVVRTACITAN